MSLEKAATAADACLRRKWKTLSVYPYTAAAETWSRV